MNLSEASTNTINVTGFSVFQYLNKFDLAPVFSEEEFKHWFIPRPGIVDSFVVEVGKDILTASVNSSCLLWFQFN